MSTPEAINYIHMILNLYNQLNKFVAFRNAMKLSMHGRGLCNEARHERNQSNKVTFITEAQASSCYSCTAVKTTLSVKLTFYGDDIRWVWHTHIEAIKEVLAWAMNKHFRFSNNIVLLKTVVLLSYQSIKLTQEKMRVSTTPAKHQFNLVSL